MLKYFSLFFFISCASYAGDTNLEKGIEIDQEDLRSGDCYQNLKHIYSALACISLISFAVYEWDTNGVYGITSAMFSYILFSYVYGLLFEKMAISSPYIAQCLKKRTPLPSSVLQGVLFLEEYCEHCVYLDGIEKIAGLISFPTTAAQSCSLNRDNTTAAHELPLPTCSNTDLSLCNNHIDKEYPYVVNLLYIPKKPRKEGLFLFGCGSDKKQKVDFENRLGSVVIKWVKKHPDARINIFTDGEHISREIYLRSQRFLCEFLSKNGVNADNVSLVNLMDLPELKNDPFIDRLLDPQINIYIRKDFFSIIASIFSAKNHGKIAFYSDLDKLPPSKQEMFATYNQKQMKELGYALLSTTFDNKGATPGFFAVTKKAEKLLKKTILDPAYHAIINHDLGDKYCEYLIFYLHDFMNLYYRDPEIYEEFRLSTLSALGDSDGCEALAKKAILLKEFLPAFPHLIIMSIDNSAKRVPFSCDPK